jgi:hypothetical protein
VSNYGVSRAPTLAGQIMVVIGGNSEIGLEPGGSIEKLSRHTTMKDASINY